MTAVDGPGDLGGVAAAVQQQQGEAEGGGGEQYEPLHLTLPDQEFLGWPLSGAVWRWGLRVAWRASSGSQVGGRRRAGGFEDRGLLDRDARALLPSWHTSSGGVGDSNPPAFMARSWVVALFLARESHHWSKVLQAEVIARK